MVIAINYYLIVEISRIFLFLFFFVVFFFLLEEHGNAEESTPDASNKLTSQSHASSENRSVT